MKSNPSESTTAYFSVHVTCPTVYRSQIVSKAVCPTWCTYLYQEWEKNRPPLENSSGSPLLIIQMDFITIECLVSAFQNGMTLAYSMKNGCTIPKPEEFILVNIYVFTWLHMWKQQACSFWLKLCHSSQSQNLLLLLNRIIHFDKSYVIFQTSRMD